MSRARAEIRSLQRELDGRLHDSQSKETDICRKREFLYSDIFMRLIEHVYKASSESPIDAHRVVSLVPVIYSTRFLVT